MKTNDCGKISAELTETKRQLKATQDELKYIKSRLTVIHREASIELRPNLSQIKWSVLSDRIELVEGILKIEKEPVRWKPFSSFSK